MVKTENNTSEIIPRLYMKLIPIQIVLIIISGINSIIDNAFAGNLIGAQAMAVTGLFCPATNLISGINALIFGGAQVLCGKYLGKKMAERTRGIFSLDIIMMSMISAVLLLVCEVFSVNIAAGFGAKGELIGELAAYIRGYAPGLPFVCLGTQFTAFLQLEHQERLSYKAIMAMFVANSFCNWLFIAVFKMGLFGLGLATSCGNLIFFIIQALYFFSDDAVIRFSRESVILSDVKDILYYGLPGAATQFCISLRGLIINALIQHYVGQDGLTSYSAIYSFACVYWSIPAAVSSAVMVLGSVYTGEEDRNGLKILMKTFLTKGVALALLGAMLISACCYPLTNIFFHNPNAPVYRMTEIGFILYPMYMPLSAITVGFSNFFHCLSYEKLVRTMSVVDGLLGVSLFSILLVPFYGMYGIWMGQLLGGVLCVAVVAFFIIVYNRKIPRNFDELLCFGKDFGVSEENRIDITIHNMDDVINLSKRVWEFCTLHGVSGHRRNCSSLCTEELAGNIVRHGFKDGKRHRKKHSIDIGVSYVNEEMVICFKDDGIPFNPEEASRLFDAEASTQHDDEYDFHNIGLRLAGRISESMTYQNTFGLNILTIVV